MMVWICSQNCREIWKKRQLADDGWKQGGMVYHVSWDQFWRCFQGIMQDGRNMRPGYAQAYSDDLCLITNNKIGDGVYFSNHIEVCEYYAKSGQPTKIQGKQFIVAFQSRVKPEALRQCPNDTMDYFKSYKDEERAKNRNYNKTLDEEKYWKYSYFVVNDTIDIRPYRILLKEL